MSLDPQALDQCDREPIHIPGSIQDFGALLVTDARFEIVTRMSENVPARLGRAPESVLGASVYDVFPSEIRHAVRNVLGHPTIATQREHIGRLETEAGSLDVSAHTNGNEVLFELVAVQESTRSRTDPIAAARTALGSLGGAPDVTSLLRRTVDSVRRLTGHARVMAYRFLPDDSGEVLAESCSPEIGSYLGHRYPAFDIPKPARELYLKMPLRMIADVETKPVPILDAEPDAAPLDLSLATLRSTSPIHLEYLRNMGVRSSMSMPLIVGGSLFGLIACHDQEPRTPSQELLFACELTGQLASMHLQTLHDREQERIRTRARSVAATLTAPRAQAGTAPDLLAELRSLIPSETLVVTRGTERTVDGDSPPDETQELLDRLLDRSENRFTAIEDLSQHLPAQALDQHCGLAGFSVEKPERLRIQFLRHESALEIRWGGRPEKVVRDTASGHRLHPRASFESYRETVRGRCEPFSADQRAALSMLRDEVDRILDSRVAEESDRRRLLRVVGELNHRVKNVFAVVRSLARQSSESADSLEHYAQNLEGRILALARAHDALLEHHREAVPLRDLLTTELLPYRDRQDIERSLHGLDLRCSREAISMLVLVFHELAANAGRHGALSGSDGTVEVRWREMDEGIELLWVESGGPEPREPEREGFGLSIIRHTFATEFGSPTDVEFRPSGLYVRFVLPRSLFTGGARSEPAFRTDVSVTASGPRPRHRALVVEDDFLLASGLRHTLESLGYLVESARDEESAARLLESRDFDLAFLDLQLHEGTSRRTAERLSELQIPFAILSGQDSSEILGPAFSDRPFLRKPAEDRDILRFLDSLRSD